MKIYEKFYVICYCVLNAEFMNVAPSRHLVSFHFLLLFITVFYYCFYCSKFKNNTLVYLFYMDSWE